MTDRLRYHKHEPPKDPGRLISYTRLTAKPEPLIHYQQGEVAARSALGPTVDQQLEILSPAQDLDPLVATELLQAYFNLNRPLILSLSASEEQVSLAVVPQPHDLELVERATRGVSPLLDISRNQVPSFPLGQIHLTCAFGQGERLAIAPLKRVDEFKRGDPLHAILEQVMPLEAGEAFNFYLFIRPISEERGEEAEGELWGKLNPLLAFLLQIPRQYPKFPPELHKIFEERLYTDYLFECLGILSLRGPNRARLWSRAQSLSAALPNKLHAGFGGLQLGEWSRASNAILRPDIKWLIISAAEVAPFWHPISQAVQVPGVIHTKRPERPLPPVLLTAKGIQLGTYRYRGEDLPISIPEIDFHAIQSAITGQTGMGKSWTLASLAAQVASSKDRHSVLVLDAHGLLTEEVLSVIPESRLADVALFDLGDTDPVFSFPWLQQPQGADRDDLTQIVFKMFHTLLEGLSPTRMTNTIYALSSTLCSLPNSSLLDIPKLFDNSPYRRKALGKVSDPVTLKWWARFDEQSASTKRDIKEPVLNRLDALYRTRAVRNLLCQRSGVDVAKLLRERKIILISLAGKSILGEKSLIGDYFTSQLHLDMLSRLGQDPYSYPRTHVFIDEASNYRGPSLPALFSEARKVNINITLASQYLKQFSDSVAEAIYSNAMMLSFACGPMDGPLLSRVFKPLTADDLESLDPYECAVKLRVNRQTMPPLVIKSLPLQPVRSEEDHKRVLEQIRNRTRQQFARPRAEVEAEFARDAAPPEQYQEDGDVEEA